MDLRLILAFIVLPFLPTRLYAGEPLRAGVDVPEPTIVKKVEIQYPYPAGDGAQVVLNIMIDQQGSVVGVPVGPYDSALVEAAQSSVWKWRFSPTIVMGNEVSISATIVILFSTYRMLPTIDLGAEFLQYRSVGNRATVCTFPVLMDHTGTLKEEPDDPVIALGEGEVLSRKQFCGTPMLFSLSLESDVPFSRIEETLKMQKSSVRYLLKSPRYCFPFGSDKSLKYARPGLKRLYYSALIVSNGSQFIQLAGTDPDVRPPKFGVDFSRLAQSFPDSKYRKGAVYLFRVFVDESGDILGVESSNTQNEAVVESLIKGTVIAPGTRNGKPIPTAVTVAIPVK
jgi:hypothetical protein